MGEKVRHVEKSLPNVEGITRLSDKEERYHRQRLIEGWNQEKIRCSRVFIAGVGALGSVVALNLAMVGVGELVLADYDVVEVSNLNRQLIFRESDVGRSKAEAAADFLSKVNPDVEIKALPSDIAEVPRSEYEKCDVIVDGLDTLEARRWLNSLAVEIGKPLIHGGIYGWWGNVQVVVPHVTPCLECQPLVSRERLAQECTPAGRGRRAAGAESRVWTPAVVTVSCVVGGIQAQETVKVLLGAKPLSGYLFYDGLSGSFTLVELERNPRCVVCGDDYATKGVECILDPGETVGSFKERIKAAWGLKEPVRVVHATKIVSGEEIVGRVVREGDTLLVYDQTRAKPIKVRVRFS